MPRDPAAIINRFEDIVDRRTAKSVVDADPYAAISYNATPVAIRRFEDKPVMLTPTMPVITKRSNMRSLVRPAPVVVPELPPSKSMATQFVMIAEPRPFSWAGTAVVTSTPQNLFDEGSRTPSGIRDLYERRSFRRRLTKPEKRRLRAEKMRKKIPNALYAWGR